MAYTTINKPNEYFNTLTWTADGTSPRSFTGVGFQPDLVWGKRRSVAADHNLFDVVRGVGSDKSIQSNATSVEGDASASFGYLSSLDSDGFTTTTGSTNNNYWNNGTDTYVAWNWLAGGTASSNTDGTITSSVSANTTSGFSVVSYTGNGTDNATVGHGLGAVPKFIIYKELTEARNWYVFTSVIDGTYDNLALNLTDAKVDRSITLPTSSLFSLSTSNEHNASSQDYIAYCFADVKGFSKFGSYVGNGSTDGTFVYTGFKPSWLMVKRSSSSGTDWYMFDNKRNTFNVTNNYLDANTSDSEASNISFDFTSNGFKLRDSQTIVNGSGSTYIYMAFAEAPIVGSNNVPANAR